MITHQLQEIAPGLMDDNPWQPRQREDPDYIQGLAADIQAHGLINPVRVRPHPKKPGRYQLASGHNRCRAWALSFNKPMPAFVITLDDKQMAEEAVRENIRRLELNPVERARALRRYIDEFKVSEAEAGKLFGLESQGGVSNVLRLLKLPEPVQNLVAAGELSQRQARKFVVAAGIVPATKLTQIAKDVSTAKGDDQKETIITEDLEYALFEHGRNLDFAGWDLHWPKAPIAVDPNGAGQAGPTVIAACKGCSYNVDIGSGKLCTRLACYDLKAAHWAREALQRAAKKLGIPVADPQQAKNPLQVHILFDGANYSKSMDARRLIQAKRAAELGLCLLESQANGNAYYAEDVFGYRGIALGTTNKMSCERYLKGPDKISKNEKPKKELSPAVLKQQKAALKRREEAERAARRAERAADRRLKYDVSWLVTNAARLIGERIKVHGRVLAWLVEDIHYDIHDFELLCQFERDLEKAIRIAKGDEWEGHLRTQIAFRLLCGQVIHHDYRGKPDYKWEITEEKIADLADEGKKWFHHHNGGFGVKLPSGWNKPPIHKTEFNCWHCGTFASSETLTKRDQAEGWEQARKGQQVVDVRCPKCARGKNGKLPAKNGAKKK